MYHPSFVRTKDDRAIRHDFSHRYDGSMRDIESIHDTKAEDRNMVRDVERPRPLSTDVLSQRDSHRSRSPHGPVAVKRREVEALSSTGSLQGRVVGIREISDDSSSDLSDALPHAESSHYRPRYPSPDPIRKLSSLNMVQTVWNPSTAHDTTVHFELDVAEDIEGHIEEFSYLKRLGNFKAAEKYFHTNLQDYIDLLPVTVEYADMLLEQGAYKRLVDFYDKQTLLDDDFEDAARFSYNFNLKLIGVCARIYADGLTIQRLHKVRNQKILLHMEMQEFKTNYYINSIEVR